MPRQPLMAFDDLPKNVIHDIEYIRSVNPQRFEMEQLTAVTYLDSESRMIVGYRDVTENEFWVRGHMPNFPIMPGVVMIEAAAQLGAFYCKVTGCLANADFVGLGGVDEVRFRGAVRPGDRLWLVGHLSRPSQRMAQFYFQGFVEGKLIFEVTVLGIPMNNIPTD